MHDVAIDTGELIPPPLDNDTDAEPELDMKLKPV